MVDKFPLKGDKTTGPTGLQTKKVYRTPVFFIKWQVVEVTVKIPICHRIYHLLTS